MAKTSKFLLRLDRFLRNLIYQTLFWYACFLFYIFISGEKEVFVSWFNVLLVENLYLVLLIFSFSVSVLFAFLDLIFTDRVMRYFPVRLIVFIKSLFYFASAFLVILITHRFTFRHITSLNYHDILEQLPDINISILRFLVFFYICGFLFYFLQGMRLSMGRRNFVNWLIGFLNKPREEKRIFMFLDMKSSTTIAEKLKHKKFSHLVQDIFNEMAIIDSFYGEIYQYLGDGAIISWSLKNGLKQNNFLNAYFTFRKLVEKRSKYYQRKYDLIPRFKAGVHAGEVMVLQVGKIRRDISYNGDTINTAARIESLCNEYRQEFLISGDLYEMTEDKNEYNFKEVGKIKLKGKRKQTSIYQVKAKARPGRTKAEKI